MQSAFANCADFVFLWSRRRCLFGGENILTKKKKKERNKSTSSRSRALKSDGFISFKGPYARVDGGSFQRHRSPSTPIHYCLIHQFYQFHHFPITIAIIVCSNWIYLEWPIIFGTRLEEGVLKTLKPKMNRCLPC